jgi:uncharacterized protein (UPF0332 family)
VLEPTALIIVARSLVREAARTSDGGAFLGDAFLQRAVSTAYYAVFHMLIQEATRRFVGEDRVASSTACILYRGFEHRTMRAVCEDLQKPTLKAKYQQLLRRSAVSAPMREFATSFAQLQDNRHSADYDPHAKLTPSEATQIIDEALSCALAFGRAEAEEKAEILALLLVGARG